MSLVTRDIQVKLALNGDTFDGSSDTLTLSGLRCRVKTLSYSGSVSSFNSQVQLRISGMLDRDMAKLSTLGFQDAIYTKNSIQVLAGDSEMGMTQIFSGSITSGLVDYNAMPDVGVDIIAFAGMNEQLTPIAASSYKGTMDVATMVQGICASVGLQFVNHGVTQKLMNHACGGTAIDQIRDICLAAGVLCLIKEKTVNIWPEGKALDETPILLSAATGLVGYPRYVLNGGLNVTSIFNPQIVVGGLVQTVSSIPKPGPGAPKINGQPAPGATGIYYVWSVEHELASQDPKGPWFTHAHMSVNNFNAHV